MKYSSNSSVAHNLETCLGKTNKGSIQSFLKIGISVYNINKNNYHQLMRYHTRLQHEESYGHIPQVESSPGQFSPIDFYIAAKSEMFMVQGYNSARSHYQMLFPISEYDNIKSCFTHENLQKLSSEFFNHFAHTEIQRLYVGHVNNSNVIYSHNMDYSLHKSVLELFEFCLDRANQKNMESYLKMENNVYHIDKKHFDILKHYNETHLSRKADNDLYPLSPIQFTFKDGKGNWWCYETMFPSNQHGNIQSIFQNQKINIPPNLLHIVTSISPFLLYIIREPQSTNLQDQGHPVTHSLHSSKTQKSHDKNSIHIVHVLHQNDQYRDVIIFDGQRNVKCREWLQHNRILDVDERGLFFKERDHYHWTPYITTTSKGILVKIPYNEHDIYYNADNDLFPVSLQRMLRNRAYQREVMRTILLAQRFVQEDLGRYQGHHE